jgi:predicted MPP superfamily phosphohydrolase
VVAVHAYHEATQVYVNRISIELERLPQELDGFELVQLSDIHFENYTSREYVVEIVRLVNELNPKLVVITGDFVTKFDDVTTSAKVAGPCGEVLKGLKAPLGVYCVLGNHDAWSDPVIVTDALRSAGLLVLINQSVGIEQNGKRFWLLGAGCYSHGDTKLWECVRGVPKEEPRILLVHEPDFADKTEKYIIDLQLSGHSHGGQIRFPVVGGLYYPPFARRYPMGLYRLPTHQLYTNVGVGCIGLPMRLMCPPEITHITLKTKQRTT